MLVPGELIRSQAFARGQFTPRGGRGMGQIFLTNRRIIWSQGYWRWLIWPFSRLLSYLSGTQEIDLASIERVEVVPFPLRGDKLRLHLKDGRLLDLGFAGPFDYTGSPELTVEWYDALASMLDERRAD